MVKKPRVFSLVTIFIVGVIFSFPLQAAYLYGHSLTEVSAIFNKISLLNWMAMASMAFAGHFVTKASPWVVIAAPVSVLVVFWNNLVVGTYHTDFSLLTTSLGTIAFALLFIPLLSPTSRMVLMNPHKRWWLRPKRYKTKVSATLNPFVGQTIHAETFDISSGGAFIHLNHLDFEEAPKVGETLRLSLNINSMRKIRCDAVIVRRAESRGRYPQGLGIRFVDLDKDHQKTLQRFLEKSPELSL